MLQKIWYNFFRLLVKTGLFFYSKKIKVSGTENIPKKGAILFCANHPDGMIDPLMITTNCPRISYYLVRAAAFNNPLIKKFLESLNLMPVYRIRDGLSEVGKNKEIFENCFELFKKGKTLLIYPEASHNRKRTIRTLSKGFTRIVFGTLDKYPNLEITIIPVGLTYQNASFYPSKVSINYGKPIAAKEYYNSNELNYSVNKLKNEVSNQLKKLSVHIADDEKYTSILSKLNSLNIDFTNVDLVNKMIAENNYSNQNKRKRNFLKPLYYIIILNSFLPMLIWKRIAKKIDEVEFVDTFRFAINIVTFPVFYGLQTWILSLIFNWEIAVIYLISSLLLILIYSKLSPTNTENEKYMQMIARRFSAD
ncbi:lysophospholipid acyltransferase family protein [Polaribacter glomeratus]|uniref:Acyltransferase n=1 Tax=Polaribacter glomeratus TaxID=102 RepID=A0A2S7WZG0_9FLAO|nr:lysophospholipid acyltransferase family protein [Polaribacter glomeratus]PQJ82916.1 acyltransferase [Polaribacter glomeratus]TXD65753.1 acyltransferase [Polaribacter glomeratus]